MLDKLIPTQLPYPIRGAIIRGIRVFVAMVLGGVAASIANGSLIAGVAFIPPAYGPAVLLAAATLLASVDKYLRERGLVADDSELPPDNATPPATDSTGN